MKKAQRVTLLATILACVLSVAGITNDVYAYQDTCRAWTIGVEGGNNRDETVCVYVNNEGKAQNIQMQNNSLVYYYGENDVATPTYVCLNRHDSFVFQSFTLSREGDCTSMGSPVSIGLPDDPVSILNRTEELLKKKGENWNNSILTGEVEGKVVSSINGTYNAPSGVIVEHIDCSIVGGEPNSDGSGCKNTEKNACEGHNGTWYENTSDDRRHDSSLTKGLGTCYNFVKAAAVSNSNGAQNPEATCMNSDLDTLGWILCPAMDLLSSAAQGAYDNFVKPALQVDPVLFTGDGQNNGTFDAWGVFRNIANSLFIVLLLAVIFSQLTGLGIDNYGIKKVLPKMIVAAIMINLSYWICVVLVDISNIVGSGLQALFDNLPTGDVEAAASGMGLKGFSLGLLTAAGIAPALATSIFAAGGGVALALTLFVSLIGVIVSIFFLFVLLAAREAAIVVLTVVSPVLIACYMLPNTKSMFDKWSKFLWALLMIYPVAGLLVGGGNFVSKLLLVAGADSGEFFLAFVAMLAGIIPIFFIPTVLKNSLNAAGELGAKISGMGQKVGGRLSGNMDKSIRGSQRYQAHQNEVGRKRQLRGAEGAIKRANRSQRFRAALGMDPSVESIRQQARAQETIERMGTEDIAAMTVLAREEFANQEQSALEDAWVAAKKAGDYDRMEALTNVMTEKNGGKPTANFLAGQLEGMDIKSNAEDLKTLNRINQTMRRNSSLASAMTDATPDAYQMVSSGGMGDNGLENLSWFSEHQQIASKNTDYAKMSASAVKRMAAAGSITAEIAQKFMASNDKDVVDALSDADKRAAWEAVAGSAARMNEVTGVGDTFTAQTASGEHTFTRQADGRWQNESGENMGGGFSVRVEQDQDVQRQIQANAKKNEIYRNMSDEKILDLATDPHPQSQAVQNSAVAEAKRRGLDR